MYTGLKYVAVGPHAGNSPDSDTSSSRSPDWLLAPQANATAAGSSVLHREKASAAIEYDLKPASPDGVPPVSW